MKRRTAPGGMKVAIKVVAHSRKKDAALFSVPLMGVRISHAEGITQENAMAHLIQIPVAISPPGGTGC
jgi:hypothetical protein